MSPSPVPPNFRVVDASACVNGSKIVACFSRGIPIPVSLTVNVRSMLASWGGCRRAPRLHLLRNLTALPIRLMRICRSAQDCAAPG